MNCNVELPVAQPQYNTYGHQIITTAIFPMNPSLRNWSLSSLVFLRCNPDFLVGLSTSPEVFVSRSGYQDCPFLDRKYISLKFLGSKFHSVIRAMLNEDYYVYFTNMDDSLLRKANKNHEKIFFQSGVICGYDQQAKTYSVLTCDENWNHQVMKIPQRWLKLPQEGVESRTFASLCAIRPKNVSVDLNVTEILNNLKAYLEDAQRKYSPYVASTKVYGNIVHDYISMYLTQLIKKAIPYENIDCRVFRQLWEHKRGMMERIIAVEDALKLDHSFSEKYMFVVQQAEILRDLYASHCCNRKDKILPELRDQLLNLSKEENSLLTAFVLKIEGEM